MFKTTEILSILIIIIILGFTISFTELSRFGINLLLIAIVIFINLIAKKFTAHYYESDILIKIWSFQRYGLREHQHFKKPFPIGAILPFILTLISYGYVWWLAGLQFLVRPLKARVSKRHGFYSYTEMSEWHLALIAGSGVIANLILAVISYFIGFPEITRLSIYYAAYSLIPIGNLDGTKIFFGSRILWTTLVIICAIFIGYGLLMP